MVDLSKYGFTYSDKYSFTDDKTKFTGYTYAVNCGGKIVDVILSSAMRNNTYYVLLHPYLEIKNKLIRLPSYLMTDEMMHLANEFNSCTEAKLRNNISKLKSNCERYAELFLKALDEVDSKEVYTEKCYEQLHKELSYCEELLELAHKMPASELDKIVSYYCEAYKRAVPQLEENINRLKTFIQHFKSKSFSQEEKDEIIRSMYYDSCIVILIKEPLDETAKHIIDNITYGNCNIYARNILKALAVSGILEKII